jgi:hypothetical protein
VVFGSVCLKRKSESVRKTTCWVSGRKKAVQELNSNAVARKLTLMICCILHNFEAIKLMKKKIHIKLK